MQNRDDSALLAALTTASQQHLESILEKILPLTNNLLNQRRSDGGWSIAQCLEHLNTYSDHYLPLIEQSLITADFAKEPKKFKSGLLGRLFIKMMDPDINKSKYKAAKLHTPKSLQDPHQIIASFISNQRKLIEIIQRSEKADLNRIRISTSLSKLIRLKLGDVLQFLVAHNERHLRQAIRLLH